MRPRLRFVQRRNGGSGAMGQRSDHGGGCEQHVEHDHNLAFQPDRVEVLAPEQHVDFVVQLEDHQADPPGSRRWNMPYPSMVMTSSPCWLNTSHRLFTRPISGRLFEARVSTTFRVARIVSP